MSLSNAAAAKAQFGDLLTASQAVATHTPAAIAASKFAEYLAEKKVANGPLTAPGTHTPRPDELAKGLLADVFDPTTGRIKLNKVADSAHRQTAEFAGLLHSSLSAAGLDPNQPVNLSIAADGRIIVDNSTPRYAEIAKLFQDNPALAQAYRATAAANDRLSVLQAGAAYIKDWNHASSDAERQALWSRYRELMNNVSGIYASRMTFSPGTATAESQQILRRMGIGA